MPLLLLVLVLILPGCTSWSELSEIEKTINALQAKRKNAPSRHLYKDYKGVIHVHSEFSHDSRGTLREVIEAANTLNLDYLIMTDHSTPEDRGRKAIDEGLRGWQGRTFFMVGSELRKGGSSILALGISNYIDRTQSLDDIVREVGEQGGVAFIAHSERFKAWESADLFAGMEIYDLFDDLKDKKELRLLFDLLFSYLFYPKGVLTTILDRPQISLRRWDEVTKTMRFVGIGGSDAHNRVKIFGKTLDPYERILHVVNTYILAEDLDEESIITALKEGHLYIAFDMLCDPQGFTFKLISDAGEAVMGDEVLLSEGTEIVISTPVDGIIKLLKDGSVIQERKGTELLYEVREAGVYRTEVYLDIHGKEKPWILSNPIYVR
ncbi:MAG: hypothetical protein HY731_01290 [Candidatus Tectomicrobia bacterium]|nr:hypothetical protein [Candidatus Tectomicrobia bacterium]